MASFIFKFSSQLFSSQKSLSDRMKIFSIPSWKLSEFSTAINLLLHLQVMRSKVSEAPIRSWMLNVVSSRIITDFRKVPIIIHMFYPFQLPILFLELWGFLTALILSMQIRETALKDIMNKLAHQFAFPVKTCNKFNFFLTFVFLQASLAVVVLTLL